MTQSQEKQDEEICILASLSKLIMRHSKGEDNSLIIKSFIDKAFGQKH